MAEKVLDPTAPRSERRRWPRYNIDILIKVETVSPAGIQRYAYGRGHDIGQGGLAAYVASDFKVGETIHILMTLPHSERPSECDTVVRNRQSFRYGLEFTSLSEADRDQLLRTCRTLGVTYSL